MKNKKYHTVDTIPKFNRKIFKKKQNRYPNIQIHDHLLSFPGMGTSIKSNAKNRFNL